MVKEIILIKNGELALKGLNRSTFEDVLIKNMRRALAKVGKFSYTKSQSTIMLEPREEDMDLDDAVDILKHVFGIAALSRAAVCEKDMQTILRTAGEYLAGALQGASSFKVNAKRSDKKFPMGSPEICREAGGYLLKHYPHLHVDVHKPEVTVTIEVRDRFAFVHADAEKGAGGMPVSTGGRAAVLISGGIDSPVAAWMMAKRGMALCAVHFASPPYTSELAEIKVLELLKKVSKYSGSICTFVVPFTEIQEQIKEHCPEEYFTLIMRRYMMKISEEIARRQNCQALITGESVGQVASQTVYALACTDAAVSMPVLRPCIGLDKEEIIKISRKIDTFETSIQPYEDCCTVFTPKHPKTRPQLAQVEAAEQLPNAEALMQKAIEGARKIII